MQYFFVLEDQSDSLSSRDEQVGSGASSEGTGRPGNRAVQTSHVENQQVKIVDI